MQGERDGPLNPICKQFHNISTLPQFSLTYRRPHLKRRNSFGIKTCFCKTESWTAPSSLLHRETTDSYLLLAAFLLKTDGVLLGVSVCLKEKPLRRQEPRCYAASSQFEIRTSPDNFTNTPQHLPSKRLQTLPDGSCCRLVCDVVCATPALYLMRGIRLFGVNLVCFIGRHRGEE